MIKIENSKIQDILPFENYRIKALGYALNKQIVKLKNYSDTSRVRAMISTLQEEGVDLLAKELNTPFYDSSYDIDKKRTMVMNTYQYYIYMGTKQGVKMLLKDAFGGGDIYQEWYEYSGSPYHYYVSVESQMYTEEAKQAFLNKLKKYTRLSTTCDGIISTTELPYHYTYVHPYVRIYRKVEVNNYD